MANLKSRSILPRPRYGIFYPEGAGYLHLGHIGQGTQGSVAIVLSCADHLVYVRKRGNLIDCDLNTFANDYGCGEVFYYRIHKLIPRLMDWIIYRPLPRHDPNYFDHCSTATIWEFCSGGDLRSLIDGYNAQNSAYGRTLRVFPYRYPIPEAFIWKVFGQLVQAVAFLHHAQPPVCHLDIFLGNTFLRPGTDDDLPDCCLGDFGKSALVEPNPWNSQGRFTKGRVLSRRNNPAEPITRDYYAIIRIIKQLMTLDYEYRSGENEQDHAKRQVELFEDLELAHTGRFAGSPSPQEGQSLADFPFDGHRETYQASMSDTFYRYTPQLFDTLRQLEHRLAVVTDLSKGPTREAASNRDWSYIGKAMEEKVAERLGDPRSVNYPPVDDVFRTQLDSIETDVSWNEIQRAALLERRNIITAIDIEDPIGPFRIARLDPQTLAVQGVSRKLYNSSEITADDYEDDDEESDPLQGYARAHSELSPVYDTIQMDNVFATRNLNYSNLIR